MNVYQREMKKGLRSLLLWSLGVCLFMAASASKFAVMAEDPSAMTLMLAQLPLGLRSMFGVGKLDFTTAIGFYGMMYPYLMLLAAIHASMLGAVIVSKEERDKTSEFLYVKPARRTQILTAKGLAALTLAASFTLVNWAAAAATMRFFGESAGGTVATLMAGMLLVQLLFLALGIAAAAALNRPKAATGVATGVMLAAYLLSAAVDINGKIGWLKAFTPFSYFDAKNIVGDAAGLSVPYVLLCAGLTAGLVALAYYRFARRDLKI